jgi:transposase
MESAAHIAPYEALRAENEDLRQRLRTAEDQVGLYQEKLAHLDHELSQLKRLIFGVKSERYEPVSSTDQLPLFDQATHSAPAAEALAEHAMMPRHAQRKKPVRQVLPSHLPREVIVIEPEEDPSGLKRIGQEVTETLDYRRAKLVVIRRVRPKYVDPRDEDQGVIIAELPARPIDKGMAEAGLLAHVVIEKYVDHLPLYRQGQRLRRQGITLSDSTLGGWITATAELVEPLYEALKQEALASGYLQADETPIPVQSRQESKGKTHRGYYWVYHAPLEGLVVMDYQRGRNRDGPEAMLTGYSGALQSDGYVVYDGFDDREDLISYGCWAHARRYFFEAQDSAPDRAAHALEQIGRLYQIERALRERQAQAEERRRLRQEEAVPVLGRFKAWLEASPGLPKSPWGKAVHYSLVRWDKLRRYTEDGRIEIDNNLVENTIRPIALGRKNYLFAGSHAAAQRSAVLYSLLATCKKHEVNPQLWLSDVLSRIPRHPAKRVGEFLPHHWKRGGNTSKDEVSP